MRPGTLAAWLGMCAIAAVAQTPAANRRIEVHGHRGARAIYPENTMPAFEYAIAQGVDVVELDMGVTRDNVVVVSHDSFVKPPICSGPKPEANLRDLNLADLEQWDCGALRNPAFATQKPMPGTRMPTLDQVFDLAARGGFRFNIETKIEPDKPALTPTPEEFARLVLEVIRKHSLEPRVILQSFDFRTLHAMERIAPEIQRSALYSGAPRSFVEIGRESGAQIVSPEYRLVTPDQVSEAHAAGLKVIPWTANMPADWARLIEAGVDGIITDDPAALIAYLKDRNLR